MSGRLTNFEIYGDDPETLAAFYRELLGWRIEKAEGVDYWRIAISAPKRRLWRRAGLRGGRRLRSMDGCISSRSNRWMRR